MDPQVVLGFALVCGFLISFMTIGIALRSRQKEATALGRQIRVLEGSAFVGDVLVPPAHRDQFNVAGYREVLQGAYKRGLSLKIHQLQQRLAEETYWGAALFEDSFRRFLGCGPGTTLGCGAEHDKVQTRFGLGNEALGPIPCCRPPGHKGHHVWRSTGGKLYAWAQGYNELHQAPNGYSHMESLFRTTLEQDLAGARAAMHEHLLQWEADQDSAEAAGPQEE